MAIIEQPIHLDRIAAQIDEAQERANEALFHTPDSSARPHLGASYAGHECERHIWLKFRWALRPGRFIGRMLRLFDRGHREEIAIVSWLRAAGFQVWTPKEGGSDRFRVNYGSHLGGECDGIVMGLPGAETIPHLLECKTHNKKSFDDLEKNGVRDSKPMHYAQMQLYMPGMQTDRALYVAVCKDDDRLYIEKVKLEIKRSANLVARAKEIALRVGAPGKLSDDPSFFKCKMCDFHGMCHKQELSDWVSCRNCTFAEPRADSTWHCSRWNKGPIPIEVQRKGCAKHALHPDMVPFKWDSEASTAADPREMFFEHNGVKIRNSGEGGENTFKSSEIVANPGMVFSQDATVDQIRAAFDAEIVG